MNFIKPSFFIIGERKCATSSLYRYLLTHPQVLPCQLKEPNFFGKGKGYVVQNITHYWSLFPKINTQENIEFIWPELNESGILFEEKVVVKREAKQQYITGEASANTFYDVSPTLLKEYLPDIRLILLFRNPIDRTFSHHRMYHRFQAEGRELGFKVHSFEDDVLEEMALIQQGGQGRYLSPSIYMNTLPAWVATYGWEQLRLFFTEDLVAIPTAKKIMSSIEQHIGLSTHNYDTILEKRFNVAPSIHLSNSLRQELRRFFKPYNEALSDYLQQSLPWK